MEGNQKVGHKRNKTYLSMTRLCSFGGGSVEICPVHPFGIDCSTIFKCWIKVSKRHTGEPIEKFQLFQLPIDYFFLCSSCSLPTDVPKKIKNMTQHGHMPIINPCCGEITYLTPKHRVKMTCSLIRIN